jgi:hypothetical protein
MSYLKPLAVDNIVALRKLTSVPDKQVAVVAGYLNPGDGGGGDFFWDAGSSDADNSGTIIKPTAATTGRFKRIECNTTAKNTTLNIAWFGGVYGENIALPLQNAYAALVDMGTIEIPAGSYVLGDGITAGALVNGTKNVHIRGAGIRTTQLTVTSTTGSALEVTGMGFLTISGLSIQSIGRTVTEKIFYLHNIGSLTMSDIWMEVSCIACSIETIGYINLLNVQGSATGASYFKMKACGGLVSNCYVASSFADGYPRSPCMQLTGTITSLRFGTCAFKGGGPIKTVSNTGLTASSGVFTVTTSANHGYEEGDYICLRRVMYAAISNTAITSTASDFTVTTASAHGATAGDTVDISGATPLGYNGTWVVATATTTTFTVIKDGNLGTASVPGSMNLWMPYNGLCEVDPKSWTGRIVNPNSEQRSQCQRSDVCTVPI